MVSMVTAREASMKGFSVLVKKKRKAKKMRLIYWSNLIKKTHSHVVNEPVGTSIEVFKKSMVMCR